MKMKQPACSA